MNSIKCKTCGLSNFVNEAECRRCGYSFVAAQKPKFDKSPRSFSMVSVLMIAIAAGVVCYFYAGLQKAMDEVNASDAKRPASQPASQPAAGLSRTQADRQRATHIGSAVANSSSLNAHQKHIDETQKAMQQVSNSQSGR